ncbi:MAG: glycosyltransferase family 29 protein [Spirochaetaceae bacterium]|nr:glycosyltransferase family 29 protein [Spirochaetaceae bacterium]
MKKLFKNIFKLIIPLNLRKKINNLLDVPNNINILSQQVNELKYQNNTLSYELWKTKTLLLLKEQSPELLSKFSSGLNNDNILINSLSQTNIFNDLKNDFINNMGIFMQIFVCGTPGLSLDIIYKNQLNLAKNLSYKWQAFSNILSIFMPHYQNDEIAYKLNELFDHSCIEKNSWGTLLYISWLILRKEEEKAFKLLHIYLKKYDLETITGMIPIADLAHRNGITNEDISVSSQLFQTIIKNVNNNVLENYINSFGNNVTIAIVGNGPHELGLGKGEEIDAHDIVVRCNRYNNSEKYIKDYGKKTNIVIFTSTDENNSDHELFNRSLINFFATHSLFEEPFSKNIRQYYKENNFSNITTIGLSATRREIQQKYNINWPTTGFRAIYYFKNILKKNIKKSDIYGFALNHGTVLGGHYEDTSKKINYLGFHDFFMEFHAMQDMFKKDT